MTAKKLGAECAFPTGAEGDPGLTKREWLAGLAMQGVCSNEHHSMTNFGTVAGWAVKQADALLAELAKVTE